MNISWLDSFLSRGLKQQHLTAITLSGLSFWFLLGFPFANENESFLWLAHFRHFDLLDSLRLQPDLVATYRPLGVFTAWLSYALSGNGIYITQIFNYSVALFAWWLLFCAAIEKRVFALTAFSIGGLFFSGYIYLFHLHGVFYSPILLLIALLILYSPAARHGRGLFGVSLAAFVLSFFHQFALLIYVGFLLGLLAEDINSATWRERGSFLLLALLAISMIQMLTPGSNLRVTTGNWSGMLASYRAVEGNAVLSFAALMLCVATVLSINLTPPSHVVLLGATTLFASMLFLLAWPIILLWVFLCLVKTAFLRKWSLALMILATVTFPFFTGTGSPTYTVFVLMICSAVLPLGWSNMERRLILMNRRFSFSLCGSVLLLTSVLRSGLPVPVISTLVTPVLAEREKTFQMANVIEWKAESQYRSYSLVLSNPSANPSQTENLWDRRTRPPTYQRYLDEYLASPARPQGELLVSFGGAYPPGKVVYTVKGRYAGNAVVFLRPQ